MINFKSSKLPRGIIMKISVKKIICSLLLIVICVSLCGCGGWSEYKEKTVKRKKLNKRKDTPRGICRFHGK